MEENCSTPEMDYQDETEETLSFCDLPIYGSGAADWENLLKEHQSLTSSPSSISSSDQVFFEFFSKDCSNSSSYPGQNIKFCGKLFPSEKPVHIETTHPLEEENSEKPDTPFASRWKLNWFSKQGNPKNQPKLRFWRSKSMPMKLGSRSGSRAAKDGEKFAFSFRGLSSLALQRKLLVLGFRVPAEMELRDIKDRQSRQDPPAALFLGGGGDEKVGGGKRLWAVIGALSCGGRHRRDAIGEAQLEIQFERSRSCDF
ncbi:hypothetical protein RHMOL_Rhmol09G0213800 [Rhododendron molle]|uniref:Uncharacterized protein n=1 Tax=Rhododendron molle TaxID=49168 RepID=A0ACC0MG15_RHOML|nr:hypothetical protein RHMOL_Rhmol09G0213800 [Rhododendron molle]